MDSNGSWVLADAHQVEALILISILYDVNDFASEIASNPQFYHMFDVNAVKGFIHKRSRRLGYWWDGVFPLSLLRRVKAGLFNVKRMSLYERSWGRGDSNFYSKVL